MTAKEDEAERIMAGIKDALSRFYLGVVQNEDDTVRAERTRIGLKGYIMALLDEKKIVVSSLTDAITINSVPLEALTLLPLALGKEKMIGSHSVYANGQQIGTVQYTEAISYWDTKRVEIWAITGLNTEYTPIEPTKEISFGIENVGQSRTVLGALQ